MIHIRSAKEIDIMRQSSRILVAALKLAAVRIRPGLVTLDIDREIADYILSQGAQPAFKGFQGYPANSCVSVDEQVVHGIPGSRVLKEGEIVSIDIGVQYKGYCSDAARTYAVGRISEQKERLLCVTREALYKGVQMAREGNRLSDISHAVQMHVEQAGFSVVRELVGHGIGQLMHEEPQIPNYGPPHQGPRLKAGMVFAIEPMVNAGDWPTRTLDDHWTVVTADGSPSAHFEHNIVVTKEDPEILTEGDEG